MRVFQTTFILLATIVSACPVLAQTELETRPAASDKVLKEDNAKPMGRFG